jgi:hypothetical protein
LEQSSTDGADLRRQIVAELGPARRANYLTIQLPTTILNVAGGLLILQIIVWAVALLRYPATTPR